MGKTAETVTDKEKTTADKRETRVLRMNTRSTEATNGANVTPTPRTKATINAPAVLGNAEATQAVGAALRTIATTCKSVKDLKGRKPRSAITALTQAG